MSNSKFVFVSYSHEDRERVRPLVELLDRKLQAIDGSLFWDPDLRAGAPFNEAIHKLVREAACVVVAWTDASVSSTWVHAECLMAVSDGRLVPVQLDRDAQIRPPFNALNAIELFDWGGGESPAFDRVWGSVQKLIEQGGGASSYAGSLAENPWVVREAANASQQLRGLAGHFRSVNEVLVANSPPVEDLRKSLREVMNTYEVVTDAVKRFTDPALKQGTFDYQPYVDLAHGSLPQEIEAGRGHCGQILIHYRRVGGVRDAIKNRLSAEQLAEVDRTFEYLGTADGDAFARMTRIGDYLRNESRAIVNRILAGQEDAARRQVAATLQLLEPLEQELSSAMIEMQQLEASLGHAPSWH